MTYSVDPDRSNLIWVHPVCFYTKLVSNDRQLFAADDFSRRHFSDAFFLGTLRVNSLLVEQFFIFTINILKI